MGVFMCVYFCSCVHVYLPFFLSVCVSVHVQCALVGTHGCVERDVCTVFCVSLDLFHWGLWSYVLWTGGTTTFNGGFPPCVESD